MNVGAGGASVEYCSGRVVVVGRNRIGSRSRDVMLVWFVVVVVVVYDGGSHQASQRREMRDGNERMKPAKRSHSKVSLESVAMGFERLWLAKEER